MMEFILTVCFVAIFIWLIYKLKFFSHEAVSKKTFVVLFIIKVFSGIALLLTYTYYYTDRSSVDLYKYFDDSQAIYDALPNNITDYLKMVSGIYKDDEYFNKKYFSKMEFWFKQYDYDLYNDNRTMIRINALLRLISFNSIGVHTIILCFVSFLGLTAIFKVLYPPLKEFKILLLFSVYLVPSVLFWTSGALKESIVMAAFGFFLYYINKLQQKITILDCFILLLIIGVLLLVKFYVFVAAIPGIISFVWIQNHKKYPIIKACVVHSFFLLLILFSHYFTNYDVLTIISLKQRDFIAFVQSVENVGSYVDIPLIHKSFINIIIGIPQALYHSLFRPHIFEVYSIVTFLAAFENLIIIVSIILVLFLVRRKSDFNMAWLLFSISFTFILFTLCGLTTPVLGALVRYKTPALPFLFITLLFLSDISKINYFIQKFRLTKIVNYINRFICT